MLPSPLLLNRAGFISRQRTLGVSLGNLHLPSNLSAVFHPSCYKQNQIGSYKFSKASSPWWSQPIHPLQPRGLPAAPAASCQPSPLPLKPTQPYLNPASSPSPLWLPWIFSTPSLIIFTCHSASLLPPPRVSPKGQGCCFNFCMLCPRLRA